MVETAAVVVEDGLFSWVVVVAVVGVAVVVVVAVVDVCSDTDGVAPVFGVALFAVSSVTAPATAPVTTAASCLAAMVANNTLRAAAALLNCIVCSSMVALASLQSLTTLPIAYSACALASFMVF